MRKFSVKCLLTLLSALALIMSSCTETNDLLSTIPVDNVKGVAHVKVEKLFKALDCKIENGKIVLPPALGKYANRIDGEQLAEIAELSKALDYKDVLAFNYDNAQFFTAGVSDKAKLDDFMSSHNYVATSENGYELYKLKKCILITNGTQVWITIDGLETNVPGLADGLNAGNCGSHEIAKTDVSGNQESVTEDGTVAKVAELTEKAKTENWGSLEIAKTVLSGNEMLSFVAKKMVDDQLLCGSAEAEDETLAISVKSVNYEGEDIEVADIKEIDTDFLRYVPGSFNLVAAAGVKDVDWNALAGYAGGVLDRSTLMIVKMVSEDLSKIDGTLAIAVKVDENANFNNVEGIDALVMAHMSQANIDDVLKKVKGFRLPYTEDKKGVIAFNLGLGNKKIYVGNVDGYLGISTIPFDADQNNSYATTFLGKKFACALDLPKELGLMKDIPFGVDMTVDVESNQFNVKMKLTDADTPVLVALMQLMIM